MKKSFNAYLVGWLAAFGLFNLITFIVPEDMTIVEKYDTMFWISYVFIAIAFLGNLGCAYRVFSGDQKNAFYNLPAFKACTSALVSMTIVGVIFMAFVPVPTWIGVIVCAGVLVYNLIAVTKTVAVANVVAKVDEQVKVQTFFIKALTVEAQLLMNRTNGGDMAALTHQAYEAIRYSDPMSNDALSNVEGRIAQQFTNFTAAVDSGDAAAAQAQLAQLLNMLQERNLKCKILK